MDTSRILLVNRESGFMIWDTVEESFIGFVLDRGGHKGTRGSKSLWWNNVYAKSAFKEHTGVYFDEQDRYIIKEIR